VQLAALINNSLTTLCRAWTWKCAAPQQPSSLLALGVDTTVKLYIPRLLDKGAASPTQPATAGAPPSGKGQLVLVVEDDDDVRRLTVDILIELGYSILSANGPVQALSLLDKHPNIVLLMTDGVMPGMNGRKLAEEALRRRPDLKVLFTTGYTRNAIVHNGTLDDGVELIVKPFSCMGWRQKSPGFWAASAPNERIAARHRQAARWRGSPASAKGALARRSFGNDRL
jgi:CheY-like chemotaxis protein